MPPRTLFLRPSTMRIVFRPIPHHHPFLKYYSIGSPSPPDYFPPVGEKARILGETKPEIEEQGTPINELMSHSPEVQQDAPSVMMGSQLDSITGEATTTSLPASLLPAPGAKLDSTTGEATATSLPASPLPPLGAKLDSTTGEATATSLPASPPPPGAKFNLPELPMSTHSNMKYRYSPLLKQVTNFLMRHGKKATAQSNVNKILSILRTKPAPKPNPVSSNPLIPGTPALASLPSDPIAYLQTAIDSVAPLMKLISVKGAGGSKDIIPSPLNIRQRRRTALEWISSAADKRADRDRLPERFADEIVAVVEGRSAAWDRRAGVHRQAILARANVSTQPRRKGKNTLKFPYN